jgi:hypothetical protein
MSGIDGIFDGLHKKKIDTSPDTNNNTPINTDNNNQPIISTNSSTSTNTTTETILSTNFSTNTITIEKKLKYLDKRTQRAYYIDKDLIKKIDKLSKKFNIDKSDIVNEALKLFFVSIENKEGGK